MTLYTTSSIKFIDMAETETDTYTWSSGTSNITVSQGVATSTLDLRGGRPY